MSEKNTEKRRKPARGRGVARTLRRIFVSLLLTVLLLLLLLWTLIFSVAHGPSESMRDLLVGAAMQASATKFVPYLVLPAEEVEAIMERAAKGDDAVYSPTEFADRYIKKIITDANGQQVEITVLERDDGTAVVTDASGSEQVVEYNEWDYAVDGIQYIQIPRPNFKAYMLIIRDPSRVYVGTSGTYRDGAPGKRFNEMAEQEGCVALMNGGEFLDVGGLGDGGQPQGLTFSKGTCAWEDAYSWKTFIGFTTDNKLVVEDGLTRAAAEKRGIRDGVCFKPSQTLSSSGRLIYTDSNGNLHVSSYKTDSPAQRSAIGQRADGAVIFLVTDGRSASSLGASYNDVTQLMYEYGAVCAGMLDGGSSAVLYFRDYFEHFSVDKSALDKYQKMGLINRYVAATEPRRIPTFFCVAPGGNAQ